MAWKQALIPFLLLNVVFSQTTPPLSIPNFIPFGTGYGDAPMERRLDAITGPILVKMRFSFFDKSFDEIKLWSHGLILFGNVNYNLPHSPPGRFPLRNFVCAAPYWADTDISQDQQSNIFYRQVEDTDTLIQITNMVKKGFPQLSAHRMLWAFVATWYRVPGHKTDPGRNTFQAILTTNGLYSFTLFTYYQLEWSAGQWGGYPQIGFNAGDQINYYTVHKSFTSDVISVVNDSNIGIPGQFIFHTTGNISDVQSNSLDGLQSSPFRGSIYGGYELRLFGMCFNQSSYTVEINSQELKNCQLSTIYLTCIMPMTYEGRLKIKVFAERRLVGETDFFAYAPENNADLILSNNRELDNAFQTVDDGHFVLYFQSNDLTKSNLFQLVIYDYSAQQFIENGTVYNQTIQRIDLGLGAMNLSALSNLTIRYNSIFPVNSQPQDRFHSLGISFELVLPQTKVKWTGIFKWTARIFTGAYAAFNLYCPAWLIFQSDANTQQLINKVPPCPCRVSTTWDQEQLGFKADKACNGANSGFFNCMFHQGAKGCYRRTSTTSDAGAQCCYDNQGSWINDWKKGAGTLDAGSPDVSTWKHFFSDVLSYYSCCKGPAATVTCEKYMKHRPPGNCENMLPAPSGGKGDPHFSTLNGLSYTFNGHGEYTLFKSLKFQVEAQIRLAPVTTEIALAADTATAIVAFVIRNENQPRVQFELFSKFRTLEIRIDGRLLEFTPSISQDELVSSSLIYSDDRQLTIRQLEATKYSISYGHNGVQFIIDLRPQYDFLDFIFILPRTMIEDRQSQGLLGDLDGLVYRNGTRVSTTLNDDRALFAYGESWRTTSDSSVFYYLSSYSHVQHQNMSYRPIFRQDLIDKYGNTSRYKLAQQGCSNLTDQKGQQCIFDVLITNDSTVIQMHQRYETALNAWEDYAKLVQKDITGVASHLKVRVWKAMLLAMIFLWTP